MAVDLVVVGAASWRSGLRRASVFVTDATRTVLLTRHHSPARLARIAWEVDASGTGLWVREGWGEPARVVEVR